MKSFKNCILQQLLLVIKSGGGGQWCVIGKINSQRNLGPNITYLVSWPDVRLEPFSER